MVSTYKVLFFGSDEFSKVVLHKLQTIVQSIKIVTTERNVKSRRSSLIGDFCKSQNIPFQFWNDYQQNLNDDLNYDIGVLASFGHMLTDKMIKSCRKGVINIHGSLLPRWSGAAPIIHTILSGDDKSGVTFLTIEPKKFDSGKIISQCSLPIDVSSVTFSSLQNDLANLAAGHIEKVLSDKVFEIKDIDLIPSKAFKIKSCHSFVNWIDCSVEQIFRQYRAISTMHNLKTLNGSGKVVILRSMIDPKLTNVCYCRDNDGNALIKVPGTVLYFPYLSAIGIRCNNGWALFKEVGCNHIMSAFDFARGYINGKNPEVFKSVNNNLSISNL